MPCVTTSGLPMLGCCEGFTWAVARIVEAQGMIFWPFLDPLTDQQIADVISTRLATLRQAVMDEPFPTPSDGKADQITLRKIIGNVHFTGTTPVYDALQYFTLEGACSGAGLMENEDLSVDYSPQYAGWIWGIGNFQHTVMVRKNKVVCPADRKLCIDPRYGPGAYSNYCVCSDAGLPGPPTRETETEFEVLPPALEPVLPGVSGQASLLFCTVGTATSWSSPCSNAP